MRIAINYLMNGVDRGMKCSCGANHWFIHDEASGMGIKTCLGCGFNAQIPTEFEYAIGIPVKTCGYSHLNEIGVIRKLGLSAVKKKQYFEAHKQEIIRVWKKKGDLGVITTFPIHISTWTHKKKDWELVPDTDGRVLSGQRKPTHKQKIIINRALSRSA